jgi:hypothetical protein
MSPCLDIRHAAEAKPEHTSDMRRSLDGRHMNVCSCDRSCISKQTVLSYPGMTPTFPSIWHIGVHVHRVRHWSDGRLNLARFALTRRSWDCDRLQKMRMSHKQRAISLTCEVVCTLGIRGGTVADCRRSVDGPLGEDETPSATGCAEETGGASCFAFFAADEGARAASTFLTPSSVI